MYYFSEGLILKEYRGQGIGNKMFAIAENWVIQTKRFNTFTLATVIREENHLKKPKDYKCTNSFWQKLGYIKTDGIICKIPWKEVGDREESPKPLLFWYKRT